MSEARHRKRLRHFLLDFLQPLIAGGDLHVHLPINAEELAAFPKLLVEPELLSQHAELEEARERVVAEWTRSNVPYAPLREDPDSLALAVVVYNLLMLSHPVVTSVGGGGSAKRIASFTQRLLARIPPAEDGTAALAYHSLLHQLGQIYRTDTEVRWWVGREEFQGTNPPARLLYWKSVRRVTETKTRTNWLSSTLSAAQTDIIEALLARSPLTDMDAHPRRRPLVLRPSLLALTDADLLRSLCARLLERDPVPSGVMLAQALLGAAGCASPAPSPLGAAPAEPLAPAVLRHAAQLFFHFVSLALYLRGQTFLDAVAAAKESGGADLMRAFAALFLRERESRLLGAPRDLLGEGERPQDKATRALLSLSIEVLGEAPIDEAAQRLQHSIAAPSSALALP